MGYPADNTRFIDPHLRARAIAETAQHFADLRRYLQRTPDQIAYRLHTDTDVVLALEAGAFHQLPPGPERHRIILAYAALAGIDGHAMWTCVENLIAPTALFQSPLNSPPRTTARAVETVTAPGRPIPIATVLATNVAPTPAPAPVTHWQAIEQSNHKPSILRRAASAALSPIEIVPRFRSSFKPSLPRMPHLGARKPWRTGIAIALIATIAVTSQTSILQAGVNTLPSPVSRLVWGATDAVMLQFVKRFEGLPWIDSANPRSRRGDKLTIAKHTKR